MSRNINFVQDRAKRAKVQDDQDVKLFKKTLVALVIGGVLLLLTLGARGVFSFQLSRAEKEYEQTSQGLSIYAERETLFKQFIGKVTVLTEVFGARRNKQEALAFFRTLFDEGVSISGLSYNDEDTELSFSLTAKSVFILEAVITRLDSPEIRQRYPTISRDSLRRSSDGTYDLNITVKL